MREKIENIPVSAEIKELFNQLKIVNSELEEKENQIQKFLGGNRYLGDLNWDEREKIEELLDSKEKILEEKKKPILDRLCLLNPTWNKKEVYLLSFRLEELKKHSLTLPQKEYLRDIDRLNNLKLGTEREKEQLLVKNDKLERKLEKVRNLLLVGKTEQLISLYQKGEL